MNFCGIIEDYMRESYEIGQDSLSSTQDLEGTRPSKLVQGLGANIGTVV